MTHGSLAVYLALILGCSKGGSAPEAQRESAAPLTAARSLVEARRGFTTKLEPRERTGEPLPEAPRELFRTVRYDAAPGKLGAYLTPDPKDGKRHPAIVWITGGDCNSIGDVWRAGPAENEQTASAYRNAGLVMMFPSLRGGNDNPGVKEGFLGEVDDVLAAAEFLAQQPYVDPRRIYLGGHSTGGTLALLVAEVSDRFRAVFSFGPVDDVAAYPPVFTPYARSAANETELRSPIHWLSAIRTPTFVLEGDGGNVESLRELARTSKNSNVRFFAVATADHFTILDPINRLLAAKIIRDDIALTQAEVDQAFARR